MARYRKRPVEIEAIQWTGDNTKQVMSWADNYFGLDVDGTGGWIWNESQKSNNHVNVGDYIIRGTSGEYYPCEPTIFAATYEPVEG